MPKSFITVPPNLEDQVSLRRCLQAIIDRLDIAIGNKGDGVPVATQSYVDNAVDGLASEQFVNARLSGFVTNATLDEYVTETELSNVLGNYYTSSFIDSNFYTVTDIDNFQYTSNPIQSNITLLNKTVADPDVQEISDKVDEIINTLQSANIIN